MAFASFGVLCYLAGIATPFVWFAIDWHWSKRRRFFGEET